MNITRGAASLFGLAMLLCTASIAIAQSEPEVRRARPVDEPPVRRAVPADESIDKVLRSLKDDVSEPSSGETEGADQRQLDYANGLFTRKLVRPGDPGISKVSRRLPGTRWPGECLFLAWRMLSKPPSRSECPYQSAESAHGGTATANSPGQRHSRSRRWRSQIKTTPRRSRFFIVPRPDRRNRR